MVQSSMEKDISGEHLVSLLKVKGHTLQRQRIALPTKGWNRKEYV